MSHIAVVKVRKEPYYRREAIESGLLRHGYVLRDSWVGPITKRDLLVLWNRKRGADETEAENWECRGGTVIVMENGYLQKVDKTMYAISTHQHNGAGWFPVGTEDRFSALGFEVKPWTLQRDSFVLVCGQRGIGSKLMASPPGWEDRINRLLLTSPSVRTLIRRHPGNHAPKVPLVDDLKGASACVIWSSGAGVRALVEGVPVFYYAPHWICMEAAAAGFLNWIPTDEERQKALHRMSHGQWSVPEIASGEPFARILEGL
jgi:hypothetical protein